jgi:hypothetical protein
MTLNNRDRAVALAEQIYAALNHDRLDQMSHGAIDGVIADLNTLRSLVGRCSDINVAISSLERMKHPRANRLLKAQSAKEAAAGARNKVYDMLETAQ